MATTLTANVKNGTTPAPLDETAAAELHRPLRLLALKHADTFVVADAVGDIVGLDDGMFRDDTRVLSRWLLRVGAMYDHPLIPGDTG